MQSIYRTICQAVEDSLGALTALSRYIHDNPEPAFEERKACAAMTDFLRERGFAVEDGAGGLETAFVASAGQAPGPGVPTVALMAEYDALPIGHACGHNLIAAISAGAAAALKGVLDRTGGRLLVIGTPAEESGAGKALLVARGVFDQADFAMQVHPAARNMIMRQGLAARLVGVEFFGRMAHSSAPEQGINALTACIATFNGLDAQRAALPAGANLNGVILEGGKAGNIIPDYARASFCLRAATVADLAAVTAALRRAVAAAEALSGAAAKVDEGALYAERYPNLPMAEAYKAHLQALGEEIGFPPQAMKPASSDVGNVSLKIPMIQPYLKISDAPNHTPEFARDAVSDFAHQQMAKAAKALAMTACDLLTNERLRSRARDYFAQHTPSYTPEQLGYDARG